MVIYVKATANRQAQTVDLAKKTHAYEACTKFLRTHKPKRRIPAPAPAYQEMTTKEHLYEITVDMYRDEQELARGPKTSYVPCGLRKIAIRVSDIHYDETGMPRMRRTAAGRMRMPRTRIGARRRKRRPGMMMIDVINHRFRPYFGRITDGQVINRRMNEMDVQVMDFVLGHFGGELLLFPSIPTTSD
ncbi:hypothetical protein BJ165DRAFT_1540971 [Panaeolus papilionaceus]|nr:hypothetical protein BJ165DRAFT_1540971 [Panaeolus papilionaceus]